MEKVYDTFSIWLHEIQNIQITNDLYNRTLSPKIPYLSAQKNNSEIHMHPCWRSATLWLNVSHIGLVRLAFVTSYVKKSGQTQISFHIMTDIWKKTKQKQLTHNDKMPLNMFAYFEIVQYCRPHYRYLYPTCFNKDFPNPNLRTLGCLLGIQETKVASLTEYNSILKTRTRCHIWKKVHAGIAG